MKTILFYSTILLITSPFVFADWDLGDPYKMHYPQMPDPQGWDVYAVAPKVLADDWQCTESGPVGDVHLWGSWRQDFIGKIVNIHLSIHSNLLADTQIPFSRPGELLWERDFGTDKIQIRPYGTGEQGWYNPNKQEWIRPDHNLFHQINIVDIRDPFRQIENTIYWLDVSVQVEGATANAQWGWKTSTDHFMDGAVWADYVAGAPMIWQPLEDATGVQRMDMAFVITPEPATLALMGMGLLAIVRRKNQ